MMSLRGAQWRPYAFGTSLYRSAAGKVQYFTKILHDGCNRDSAAPILAALANCNALRGSFDNRLRFCDQLVSVP